jgi:hypothetical protein
MWIMHSGVLSLAALLVFASIASALPLAADGPAQSPPHASPVTGGVARSVASEPADRHAETITLTVVCETPEGKPIAGADAS